MCWRQFEGVSLHSHKFRSTPVKPDANTHYAKTAQNDVEEAKAVAQHIYPAQLRTRRTKKTIITISTTAKAAMVNFSLRCLARV